MVLPFLTVEYRTKRLGGLPHVDITQLKRCEAEAHDVWLAEISDDAACDQSLDRAKAIRIRIGNLAAALGGISRRQQF